MKKLVPLIIGGLLVVAVIVGVALFAFKGNGTTSQTQPGSQLQTIKCIGGSEKSELMADADIQKLLTAHGLKVDFSSAGSYDQVQKSTDDLKKGSIDCLWPSSASAQSVFESLHKGQFTSYKAESVLQSPEVVYAGPQTTDALTRAGIVQQVGQQYFLVDLKKLLLDYTLKGAQWESLGANGIYGPVKIGSTDPAKSNSGFTMAQLELNVLATDNVYQAPSEDQAKKALPTVRALYDAQGLQASSSDFGFKEWLLQGGELRSPLYAGYENQLVQYWVKNPDATKQLDANVRILYPQPTVYNEHPVLALTDSGNAFLEAMKDPQIQKIAWDRYGFRSGTTVGANDVGTFKDLKLAQQPRIINPPSAGVTMLLLNCLKDAAKCSGQ